MLAGIEKQAAFPAPTSGANLQAGAYLRASALIGSPATSTRSAVVPMVPCSRSTLKRWVREGKFPAPVKLGDRMTAWRASDVTAWLASRGA